MKITELTGVKANAKFPAITPGDTVKVGIKIKEGDKERVQPFQGVIIRIRKGDAGGSFTVQTRCLRRRHRENFPDGFSVAG